MIAFPNNFEKRFWSHVDKSPGLGPNGDCWEWSASCNKCGYGAIGVGNRVLRAHRAIWIATNGHTDFLVLHKCDNRKCVRLEHLFVGTQLDNVIDMVKKGRHKNTAFIGEDNSQAKLSCDKVKAIKSMLALGISQMDVARKFGVSNSAISLISLGRSWKHVA